MTALALEGSWTLDASHAEIARRLAENPVLASDDELLAGLRSVQELRNRLAALDHCLIAELDARGTAIERGARNTATLVSDVLRITRSEATARVHAARDLGPRRHFATGEAIDPVYPQAAAAQASGVISERHARAIVDCIRALPSDIREDAHDVVERLLVSEAAQSDPLGVIRLGQQVHAHLDPDGRRPDDARRHRERGLDLHKRPDGSSTLHGDLTAEATERLETVLDALTHPRNLASDADAELDGHVDGALHKDSRSATQRRHDAFLAALKLLQLDAATPTAGGVHTTLLLTMPLESWLRGTGLARTGHGTLVPAADAIEWAGGNPQVVAVALDSMGAIAGYSNRSRCFTEQQRLALLARDGGCTFPGCDSAIWFCEADHVIPWSENQDTSVANGHLVCTFHHRQARPRDWRPVMVNGRPGWIPPPWLDPDQRPRFNTTRQRLDLPPDLPFGGADFQDD